MEIDKKPQCPVLDVDGVISGGKQFDLDITLPEDNRLIDVEWYSEHEKASYQADIEVNSNDRNGLLMDILREIGTTKAKILGVNTKTTKEKIAIIDITLEVENLDELNKAIKVVRKVDSVYDVRRKK